MGQKTSVPSVAPTPEPTGPTLEPTYAPSFRPSSTPTLYHPTYRPTFAPKPTHQPTAAPNSALTILQLSGLLVTFISILYAIYSCIKCLFCPNEDRHEEGDTAGEEIPLKKTVVETKEDYGTAITTEIDSPIPFKHVQLSEIVDLTSIDLRPDMEESLLNKIFDAVVTEEQKSVKTSKGTKSDGTQEKNSASLVTSPMPSNRRASVGGKSPMKSSSAKSSEQSGVPVSHLLRTEINSDLLDLSRGTKVDPKLKNLKYAEAHSELKQIFDSCRRVFFRVIGSEALRVRTDIDLKSPESSTLQPGTIFEASKIGVTTNGVPRIQLSNGAGWASFIFADTFIKCVALLSAEEIRQSEKEEYKAAISALDIPTHVLEFYKAHNPTKVGDVPYILNKYKDNELILLAKLQKQYLQSVFEDPVMNATYVSLVSKLIDDFDGNIPATPSTATKTRRSSVA